MTDEEYDKLKPGDIVIEIRTGKEKKFIKEYIEMLEPIEYQLKGVDSLYNRAVGRCEKYAIIEDTNKIGQKIGQIALYNFINDFKIKTPMENEVKINVPKGKKAVQSTDDNGNIVIKFEDVEPIRSKSWYGFCKNHPLIDEEWYISSNGYIKGPYISPNNRNVDSDTTFLETKEDAEGLLALIQLTRLHDEWVGNWEPGWEDDAVKNKYFITRNGYKTFKVQACWYDPRFLVFPTRRMAEEFMECFKDLLEKAKKFI